jgi:hypothetical protein
LRAYTLINGRGPTDKVLTPGSPIVQINLTGNAISDDSVDPAAGPLLMRLPAPDFNALLGRAAAAKTRPGDSAAPTVPGRSTASSSMNTS